MQSDRLLIVLRLVATAIASVRYAAAPVQRSHFVNPNFSGLSFNLHDDMQSYLVMPEKILPLGHLAPDPFNTRQLKATLGGMHMLNALGRAGCRSSDCTSSRKAPTSGNVPQLRLGR